MATIAASNLASNSVQQLELPEGPTCKQYTLRTSRGLEFNFSDLGARVLSIRVPDKNGTLADVLTGYSNLKDLKEDPSYMGCTVGRYANRIAGAKFSIGGTQYTVPQNEPAKGNCLHGGPGIHRQVWNCSESTDASVTFQLKSPDGEAGFPGNLELRVKYEIIDGATLVISYFATTDKPTVVNLTNHAYFNLAGVGSATILDHELQIPAETYLPINSNSIPTGEYCDVANTPFDFRAPTRVGSRIHEVPDTNGYDHCYVITQSEPNQAVIMLKDPISRRSLEVTTSQPGVQLYTANHFDGTLEGIGGAYPKHGALCLETQHFPDAPNQPSFPSTLLGPDEEYAHKITWCFSTY